jgi:hypothetical protein
VSGFHVPGVNHHPPCYGALTCERDDGHTGWHSRLMPNGTFVEWTDDGQFRATEADDTDE